MANRIKGITIEIGGDTTGLDKALKGVNSSISRTQSALNDVNRLLKLDPTNTVLGPRSRSFSPRPSVRRKRSSLLWRLRRNRSQPHSSAATSVKTNIRHSNVRSKRHVAS